MTQNLEKSTENHTTAENPLDPIQNALNETAKAFKIEFRKGAKITDSIKKEINNKFGCRLDSLHKAYICPLKEKESVEKFFKEEGIKADLKDVTDFYPNKDIKINSLENQIEYLSNSHIKKIEILRDEISKYDNEKGLSDFKDPPIYENFPVGTSRDTKFNIETGFHKRFLECENIKEEIENLENSLSLRKKEYKEKTLRFGDYIVEANGLYYFPEKSATDIASTSQDEEKNKLWISSPIWTEAYLRDREGKNHTLLIKVYDGEKYHKVVLPRRVIDKLKDLTEILLDLGQKVSMSPTNQKHLQNFLMHARPDMLMRCVDKSGWHDEQYIFPDGEVLGKTKDNNENVHPINEACPKGIEKKGSLEEWNDRVLKLCANNSRLIFGLGVAVSAPCLQLVGDEGGVFNFKGISSIGKTRCLMVAISVFGSPEFKRSWRTTANGLEGICSLHNDCLLALDEFGQSDAKEVGEIAYMYSQGIGKQRSNRDGTSREAKTWRGMLFSTGEVGIADHMQDDKNKPKAGQLVRVIDIPAKVEGAFGCFEELHGFENGLDGERFADEIKEVCGEYYGTAGREFIKAMIEHGVEKSKRYLKFSRDDFAANVARKYDGQVKRVANRFGLVFASLSLGIELGVFSKYLTKEMAENAVKSCFNDWLNDRGTTGNLESHSIINHITGLLNENSDSKFIPKNDVDDTRIRPTLWGYKDGAVFYLFSKAFNDLCKGYDEKEAKTTLANAKILLPGSGGKFSRSIKLPAHSKKERYYVLDLNNVKDDDEDTTC